MDSLRRITPRSIISLLFLLGAFLHSAWAQYPPGYQPPTPETITGYNIDWNERLTPNLGLKPHDFSLLGDHVDLLSGQLSFEHIDVSLQGNSDLPVELRRRLNPSQMYGNEFGDWQLMVPTISTKIMGYEFSNGVRWGKNRCSSTLTASLPKSQFIQKVVDPNLNMYPVPGDHDYSDGVILDVPGRASAQLLDKTVAASWPTAASKVTTAGWYTTCVSNIDGAGTEGFYAHAPNGDVYTFNVIRSRHTGINEIWRVKPKFNEAIYFHESIYYDVLAASEVRDVHGNWVRYSYDNQGRLTRIYSNDDRVIAINYASATSPLVSEVIAHPGTVSEKRWAYNIGWSSVYGYQVPSTTGGIPSYGYSYGNALGLGYISLKKVTLPDNREWQFNLGGLFASAVPGKSYTTSGGTPVNCVQVNQEVSITHPDGVVGTFKLEEKERAITYMATSSYETPCPRVASSVLRTTGPGADVMAVVQKTLSGQGMPSSVWQYSYFNPLGNPNNRTEIIYPDGTKQRNTYPWNGQHFKLIKEEVFENSSASIPLETRDYSYLFESAAGTTFVKGNTKDTFQPAHQQQVTITRGSDTYNTAYTYITDRNASNYSYGLPTQTRQWSSLGGGTRTTDITYLKDADDWILGLTDTVTKNGKLFDDYDYDTKGRLVTHKRFGTTVATLGYYTTGVQAGKLSTYKDGLNRQTSFSDYYRGIPRTITRADNTSFKRAIDADGRVTQETNWRNIVTNYQYNPSGYLTLIDRPAPWTDTAIGYTINSSGLVQTITKGSDRTVNVYDPMLRVTSSLRQDLNPGGSVTATEKRYDPMGREVFASLPKAGYPSPYGIATEYDALGRVAQVRETAPGGGTTYYEYLAGNQTRVRDPMNNITTTTASGFGSPSDGQALKIEKPQGITTDFTYNIYGNLLTMAQAKGNGTSLTSTYIYDSNLRLCRLRMPERGDTLYTYDNADQITGYAEGQAAGSACAALPTSDKVGLAYDNLGRPTTTDYPGTTPDISRTYDANGNLLTINRGGVNWTYNYNTLDLLTAETLALDGRNYVTANVYNNDGMLTAKTYPSGRQYTYNNDGLGRTTGIGYGGANYLSGITYHPNGKINTLNRGNGGTYEQRLNDRQLTSYIGGNWGDKRNYYYDANGRITSIDSLSYNAYDRGFGYDGAGRLATATGPWGTASYQYDPLGNITKKTEGFRVVDLQYSTTNRITSVRDSAVSSTWRNYGHDVRGNVTSDGRYNFSYDAANQPVSIGGATSGTYTYDGNLKRVKQVVGGETIYSIYDKSGTLVTRDNVTRNEKTDYISLAGQTFVRLKNGVATYPLNDHLGTAMMEADQNGSVPANQVYNYTPWGEIFNVVPFGTPGNDPGSRNEQGFTGHIDDMSGLVYMQARYYDPVIGRFLSTDPIGYADQLNLYAYVGNDPMNKTDPTGMCGVFTPICLWLTAGSGAAATTTTGAVTTIAATTTTVTTTELVVAGVAGTAIAATAITMKNESTEGFDTDNPNTSNPLTGEPNGCSTCNNSKGEKGQVRDYNGNGNPKTDYDFDHAHGKGKNNSGSPHAHDWSEPEDGSTPTHEDRGSARPLTPEEQKRFGGGI